MSRTGRARLAALVDDPTTVGMYPDARLIADYLARHPHGPTPLFCSIGETSFTEPTVPGPLRELLRQVPDELLGYQPSMGGYPPARRAIRDYLIADGRLDTTAARLGTDYEIALSSGGTRGVMLDWAEHLLAVHRDERPDDRRRPVALTVAPCWDYAGVVARAGYGLATLPLRAADGWLPDPDALRDLVARIDADPGRRLALVIINAQHNPTGRSWPAGTIAALVDAAATHGAGLLLDDPYYGVHTGEIEPASAPAILLDHLAATGDTRTARRWLSVRSLGKQLAANGLAVGALTTHPEVLPALLHRGFARHFPLGAADQWAVARYLADPTFPRWMAEQRAALGRKRRAAHRTLTRLGVPAGLLPVGEATPYLLIPAPPQLGGDVEGWRRQLLDTSGVLLAPASIEDPALQGDTAAIRLYLGSSERVVADLLGRLAAAPLGWHPAADPSRDPAGGRPTVTAHR